MFLWFLLQNQKPHEFYLVFGGGTLQSEEDTSVGLKGLILLLVQVLHDLFRAISA